MMKILGIFLMTRGVVLLLAFIVGSLWTHTFVATALLFCLLLISVGFNAVAVSE